MANRYRYWKTEIGQHVAYPARCMQELEYKIEMKRKHEEVYVSHLYQQILLDLWIGVGLILMYYMFKQELSESTMVRKISEFRWSIIISASIIVWIKTGRMNHDFRLSLNGMTVQNRVILFRRTYNYTWREIKIIRLIRMESQISDNDTRFRRFLNQLLDLIGLFSQRKYVEIELVDKSKKRFYCNGMEEDYYDENTHDNNFDDLIEHLKRIPIIVETA